LRAAAGSIGSVGTVGSRGSPTPGPASASAPTCRRTPSAASHSDIGGRFISIRREHPGEPIEHPNAGGIAVHALAPGHKEIGDLRQQGEQHHGSRQVDGHREHPTHERKEGDEGQKHKDDQNDHCDTDYAAQQNVAPDQRRRRLHHPARGVVVGKYDHFAAATLRVGSGRQVTCDDVLTQTVLKNREQRVLAHIIEKHEHGTNGGKHDAPNGEVRQKDGHRCADNAQCVVKHPHPAEVARTGEFLNIDVHTKTIEARGNQLRRLMLLLCSSGPGTHLMDKLSYKID
jgi:hypothetical protein